jgi:hypothetical protein
LLYPAACCSGKAKESQFNAKYCDDKLSKCADNNWGRGLKLLGRVDAGQLAVRGLIEMSGLTVDLILQISL